MGLLTFKGGVHPNDGKSLAKDKAIVELLPQGDLVYPLSQHKVTMCLKGRKLPKRGASCLHRSMHPYQVL